MKISMNKVVISTGIIDKKLSKKGFSLIELMVAVVILSIAVLGIFHAYSAGFIGMANARDRTIATNYAREAMEDIKNEPFNIIEIGKTRTFINEIKGKFSILATIQNEIIDVVEMTDLQRVITTVSWENREVELEMLIYGYI